MGSIADNTSGGKYSYRVMEFLQLCYVLFGRIFKEFSQRISIVTLREAKRGSAGVLVAKREAAGDTQSVQEMTNHVTQKL